MYLVTYEDGRAGRTKVGALVGATPSRRAAPGQGEHFVLDLGRLGRAEGLKVPGSMRAVLEARAVPVLKRLETSFRALWRTAPARARRYLVPQRGVRLAPPVPDPEKIICVGKNYLDHCREGSAAAPAEPVLFSKFRSSLIGAGEAIVLPRASSMVDYEAELGVVIGRGGRHIPRARALSHVAGYMPLNDVSARDFQSRDGQWVRAKSCDTFCPAGPAIATTDVVKDPQALRIALYLNGECMQSASTAQMIFPVASLVAFISEVITLAPGDIIATGTPSGVGVFRDPPRLLAPGDDVRVVIEKVGTLANRVVAERGRAPASGDRPCRVFS